MDIRNCSSCNKIYRYDGFRICLDCRKKNEQDFQTVKKYIQENPGATISDVVENTQVDIKKVMEFLREGRLEIEPGGNIILECEKCGTPITTGRFCNSCQGQLQRTIGGAIKDSNKNKPTRKDDRDERFRYKKR